MRKLIVIIILLISSFSYYGVVDEDGEKVTNMEEIMQRNHAIQNEVVVNTQKENKTNENEVMLPKVAEKEEMQKNNKSEDKTNTVNEKSKNEKVATKKDTKVKKETAKTNTRKNNESTIKKDTTKERNKETVKKVENMSSKNDTKNKTKSIYDYEFDVTKIKSELISIGQSMGLKHWTTDDGEKITPQNSSWATPVTASKKFQGKKLERALKDYVQSMPIIVENYGGEKLEHFTIYVENRGNGVYTFYFLY